MEVRMVNLFQGILHHEMASTAKQATLNFRISISLWLFNIIVLPFFIPKSFMLLILDFILLSQPLLIGICELFLFKNRMSLVFSKFSDSKFALNQLLISVNAPLMFCIKLVGLGLVMIRLLSSANKTNLDLLLLSLVFVIFIISLI